MSTYSIRVRLFVLVGLFAVVAMLVSLVGTYGITAVQEQYEGILEGPVLARRLGLHIQLALETANSIEHSLLTLYSPEDVGRYTEEQTKQFKQIEEDSAALAKLLTSEQLASLDQFKPILDEYRQSVNQINKVLSSSAADRAVSSYLGEHSLLFDKLAERLRHSTDGIDRVRSRLPPEAQALLASLMEFDDLLGKAVLSTDDAQMEQLAHRMSPIGERLSAHVATLPELGPDGQKLFTKISALLDTYLKQSAEIERMTRVNDRHRVQVLAHKNDAALTSVRAALSRLLIGMQHEADQRRAGIAAANSQVRTLVLAVSVLGILGALLFAFVTVRRIYGGVEAIRRVTQQVADASTQLREAVQSIAQRASVEASSLEETSSTMEEMTATVEQNRNSAARAKELVERNGEVALQNAVTTNDAVDAMVSLKQAGTKISEISDTVTEIAFQTNILALNASVEAARAGEHGRGFAVVAAEVRTLAQRTGVAAREISTLIKDSLQRIARGVELVGRSSQEMARIVEGSRESTTLVVNINTAAQEQASGIGQVTQAMMQLNNVVQANSAQAEEMSAAAESLMSQAEELTRAVALISGGVVLLEHARPAALSLRAPGPPSPPGKPTGGTGAEAPPLHSAPRGGDFASF